MQGIALTRFSKIRLLGGGVLHAILMWGTLALGYNSYKAVVQESGTLTSVVKDSIKGTFPWGILIFVILYVLCIVLKENKGRIYLTFKQYGIIIALYALLVNLLFFSRGTSIVAVLSLSAVYTAVFLLLFGFIKSLLFGPDADVAGATSSPEAQQSDSHKSVSTLRQLFKESTLSSKLIILFVALLVVCTLLLVVRGEKLAEQVAGVAYIILALGVVLEIYRLIIHGDKSEKQ